MVHACSTCASPERMIKSRYLLGITLLIYNGRGGSKPCSTLYSDRFCPFYSICSRPLIRPITTRISRSYFFSSKSVSCNVSKLIRPAYPAGRKVPLPFSPLVLGYSIGRSTVRDVLARRHIPPTNRRCKNSNHRRAHQGIGQRVPIRLTEEISTTGGLVGRRDVLGGIIHDYYQECPRAA